MSKTRAPLDIAPKMQAAGGAYLAVIAAQAALAALQRERKNRLAPMVNMAISLILGALPLVAGYLKADDS